MVELALALRTTNYVGKCVVGDFSFWHSFESVGFRCDIQLFLLRLVLSVLHSMLPQS